MGFHIIIEHKFLPKLPFDPDEDKNIYRFCRAFAKYFFDNVTELVDLKIYDSRRVCKIPYSLALFKDMILVCKPLTEKELLDFNLEIVQPENICLNKDFTEQQTFNKSDVSDNQVRKFIEDKKIKWL